MKWSRSAPRFKVASWPAMSKTCCFASGAGNGDDLTEKGASRDDFARGDWVRIDGRHLGQVLRVEGEGNRVRLVVESAGDLKRRTVDPRRRRVERLDR